MLEIGLEERHEALCRFWLCAIGRGIRVEELQDCLARARAIFPLEKRHHRGLRVDALGLEERKVLAEWRFLLNLRRIHVLKSQQLP